MRPPCSIPLAPCRSDAFYEALIDMHRDLGNDESQLVKREADLAAVEPDRDMNVLRKKRCRWRAAVSRPRCAHEIVIKRTSHEPESPGAFTSHTDTSRHYQSGFAADFATEALPARCRLAAIRRSA